MYRKSYALMALMLTMFVLLSACSTGANLKGNIIPDDAALEGAQQEDAIKPEDTTKPEDTPQPEPDEDPEDLDGGDIVLVPESPEDTPDRKSVV